MHWKALAIVPLLFGPITPLGEQMDENIIPTTMTPPPPPSPPPQPLVQHFCQLQTILVFTSLKLILEIETNIDEYFRHDYWVLLRSWNVLTIRLSIISKYLLLEK